MILTKKVLSILLSLMLVLGAVSVGFVSASAEVTLSGSGTAEDPYRIEKYEELKAFASIVNGGNSSACAVLMNDFSASASASDTWTPIGNLDNKYTGVFDGRGYVIKWLSYNSSADYAGLFGYVKGVKENGITVGGIVKNVVLEGGSITGGNNVGGVAGRIEYGTVTDCRNTGTVSGTDKVGGIAGKNEYGTVTDCSNTGDVSADYKVGGVVGDTSNQCSVTNCSNSGNVTATENNSIAGGLVGSNSKSSVANCYNTGNVSGNGVAGGVVGDTSNQCSVTNCFNTGDVSGNYNVGGVAGLNIDISVVINCYNTGTVTATGTSGYNYAGGVAGTNDSNSTVKNCYNTGNVSGNGGAGGVAGRNLYHSTVEYCYYDSDSVTGVSAIGNETEATSSHVEGLSTADMTGVSALDKMVFDYENGEESPWIVREDDTFGSYYPHLKGFDYDNTGALADWPAHILKDGPYEIGTYTQLKDFAFIVNNRNTSACAILINDIDASASAEANDWTPIGNYDNRYTGTFDGKDSDGVMHTITGLTFDDPEAEYAGLFGFVDEGGVARNVGLEGGKITGKRYVGGVVGYNNGGGIIEYCYNTGNVSGSDYVGGVVGSNSYRSTVANCSNSGNVTATENGSVAGGVAGSNFNNSSLKNCYNTGDVKANGESAHVGGVVGHNFYYCSITNCCNTGDVTVTGDNSYAGGVAGENYDHCSVTNCYNTGYVTVVTGANSRAGGVVGENGSNSTVTNCCNTGDVTVTGPNCHAGGVAGENYSNCSFTNCYNTGDVTANGSNCHAGGVAGENYGNCSVTNCYNTGDVTANGSNCHAGGVAGYNGSNCTAENCYFDSERCAVSETVGFGSGTNVKGLTTAEMTGANALENMVFEYEAGETNPWLVKADGADSGDGKYYWYYPHLMGFDFAGTDGARVDFPAGIDEECEQMTADEIDAANWPAKAEVSVTWEEPELYDYSGSEIKPVVTSVIIGDASVPAGEDATYFKYTYSGENNKWEWAESSGSPTNPGKYRMEIRSGEDTVTKYFTILETVTDYSVSYFDESGMPSGSPVNAGDYKAVVTFTDTGHNNIEKKFTIDRVDVTVTAASEEFTYDGTAHSNNNYEVDGLVGSDAITAVVTGSITYPSDSPVPNVLESYEFTSGRPDNYNVTTVNGELTMSNASVAITITSASGDWIYDGNAHSDNTVKVTGGELLTGDTLVATATGSVTDVSDTATGNNQIAEGYKIMHGDKDVTANYTITAVNGTLTVNPAPVTLTADSAEETYDSTEITASGFTSSVEGLSFEGVTASGSGTDAGTYDITFSGVTLNETKDSTGNYVVTETVNGKLTITPRLIWYTAEARLDNDSFVYDGTAKEPELAFLKDSYIQKELVEGVDYKIIHKEWKNNINASDAEEEDVEKLPTALFAIEGMGNYYHSMDQYLIFSIEKADPEVTAPVPVEGLKADGTPKALVTAGSTTGGTLEYSLDGENYSAEIPEASEEGTYTVYYRVAGDGNYNDVEAQTVSAAIGENIHTITFIIDGKKTTVSCNFGEKVEKPADPVKEGYTFSWEEEIPETMPAEDVTISGKFTPIEYTATFVDENGKTVREVKFTVESESIDEPAVPEKEGYTGEWSKYTLAAGDIEITAVYTELPAAENDNVCPLDKTDHGTTFMGKIIKFFHSILWWIFRAVGLNLYIHASWVK